MVNTIINLIIDYKKLNYCLGIIPNMNYTTIDMMVADISSAIPKWLKVAKYIDGIKFYQYCNYEELISSHINEINLESREIEDLSDILIAVSDITYDLDCAIEKIEHSTNSREEIHDNIRRECGFAFSAMIRESNRAAVLLQMEITDANKRQKTELEKVKFSEYKLMHDAKLQTQKMSSMIESEKQLHAIVSHLSASEFNKIAKIQEMAEQIEDLKRKLIKAKKSRSPKSTHRNVRRE